MTNNPRGRKVVLGATCFADAKSAIELSGYLAEATNAGLKALLFEDETFYHLANLPFARAISAGSNYQTVTPQSMLEAFKRDAISFKNAIEEMARKKALDWSFEKKRGQIDLLLSADYIPGDILVMGYQRLRKNSFEILVLDIANDTDSSLIQLAANLAKAFHLPLHVVLFPDSPDEELRVSQDAESRLRQHADKISFITQENGYAAFLNSLQKSSPSAIITSGQLAARIGVSNLIDSSRSPVIISTD